MTLSDICELIVDCPHSTAKDEGAGYPLIRTPNIGRGRLILDDVHRVSKDIYDKRNARAIPQDDDLILAREAPAGNVAIIKNGEQVCLGQRTVLIRPDKRKVYPDFLVYYILAPQQQYELLGTANGATVAHVNIPVIKALPVELPAIEVQQKAADILKAYDDLIENNQKQIKLLEEAAQRLYKEWFVDLHFPGCVETEFVDGVPEGWQACSLDDVIDFNPKVTLDKERIKESVPMSALSTSSMVLDSREFTKTMSNSGSKFQNGDTLLARITPCLENGKTGFVDNIESPEGAVGSTEFIVMRSKRLNLYMVYLLSRTEDFRKTAINSMTGSDGRQRAQVNKIKSYSYVLPPKDIISVFGKNVDPIFLKISKCNRYCKELAEARDRLLPKLMSGEIEL
jgi:type I restriction enzyme S subunit